MAPLLSAGATAPIAAPRPGPAAPARSFGAVLEERRAPLAASPPDSAASAPSPALRVLASVDHARVRLEGVLAAARSGRTFTPQELLGLQAEAYRTVQTVDLAVKAAEQGAQSVRQALATQV
jgi:hypothetical protein